MSYSLDINLLIYSSDLSSPFHAGARNFLESCMSTHDILISELADDHGLPEDRHPPVDLR